MSSYTNKLLEVYR